MSPNIEARDFKLNPEIYSDLREVNVDSEKFFLMGKPAKIAPNFMVTLTEMTYLPKIADPRRDWVASVAAPAFQAHAAHNSVRKFAAIGTGAGLDAIAALEVFDLNALAVTDLHPAVVAAAAENIKAATAHSKALSKVVEGMLAVSGDLLTPLATQKGEFDLIYENLPNIPLDAARSALQEAQTSSTYVPSRQEAIPPVAKLNLLALHWLALKQARDLLSPSGAIVSSMGGRVPIASMMHMVVTAGYTPSVLTYTWKIQSEPEEVIGGYKTFQEQGLGPFFFYPAKVLEAIFSNYSAASAANQFQALENLLVPHRLDSVSAYHSYKQGIVIGHTVVVVCSTPIISANL